MTNAHPEPGPQDSRGQALRRNVGMVRFAMAAAVLGSLIASLVVVISGLFAVLHMAWKTISDPKTTPSEAKQVAVDAIEMIDVFLLSAVLFIVALGLYELFIDSNIEMPPWLLIRDIDDLKEKLVGVIIVLLGVTFLGSAVSPTPGQDLLELGVAIALVIAALSFQLFVSQRKKPTETAKSTE